MPNKPPVTIMDVAKAAGVSFSTVSLALRQPLRVRAATREKIEEAVTQLGYERNPMAAALASRAQQPSQLSRASMIAYVTGLPGEVAKHGNDPFSATLRKECDRMGYGFELVDLEEIPNRASLGRNLRARGCVGVVFGQIKKSSVVAEVDWRPFSMVRCNNDTAHLDVHRVESDVFDAAWKATGEVISRGYQKAGLSLFRHARGFDDDVRRAGAFQMALKEKQGTHAKAGPVFSHDGKWNRDKFMRWFEKHPVDALVCFGVQEYYWLQDAGIRVPEDVAIVALTSAGENATPVTGFHEDFERITLTAFRMCEQFIRMRELGFVDRPQALNVPCLWHEGVTLPEK